MNSYRKITKDVFDRCPETCPAVDKKAEQLVECLEVLVGDLHSWPNVLAHIELFVAHVKDVSTMTLRDALTQAVTELHAANERIEDLEDEVRRLEHEPA